MSNPNEEEGSITVSAIYGYDKARPSWDSSYHKWPWGSESRSQHCGSHCLGHHPMLHMCIFPFCFYLSIFSLLKGKKPNRCL